MEGGKKCLKKKVEIEDAVPAGANQDTLVRSTMVPPYKEQPGCISMYISICFIGKLIDFMD